MSFDFVECDFYCKKIEDHAGVNSGDATLVTQLQNINCVTMDKCD